MAVLMVFNLSSIHQLNKEKEMKEEKMKIEVWSDVVCPFCLVGKKNLEQAINNLHAEDKVEVIWHSYQLDPVFPKDASMLYYPYHLKRSGYTERQLKPMGQRLNQMAEPYGIKYNFEKVLVVNSIDLHRLLFWSKKFDLYDQLNEAFMMAYFTKGVDLSKDMNVLEIIDQVGLNVSEAKNILSSDAYFSDVKEDIQKARELGIRGVPFFLINKSEKIAGAQDIRSFEVAISSALQKTKLSRTQNSSTICLPEKGCGVN
jgi:predicted DsbA family dithiol-disulfide isomerase